ncbi:MAG: methylmalonyl-CoA mutase family protein [Candidatus Riflebacteria bacterium]|nr:methylmalonyl-CoA mutase family protein [Candidatus Riflebacteria bacterium]
MESETLPYQPKNHIRIVTAASLFDGHDAAINIVRRLLQSSGAEVIHLGHNRSAKEIVECAIAEDVQGIAITSYQGGHMEFFKYLYDLFKSRGAKIKIFGGGGGTILPSEIEELQHYGIERIYSPDDGRHMGLQGMINDVLEKCDFPTSNGSFEKNLKEISRECLGQIPVCDIAKAISFAENHSDEFEKYAATLKSIVSQKSTPVLGVTGTGGSGKSSFVDEFVRRFSFDFPEKTLAIISIDPSKKKGGGALLGDRIRMNNIFNPRIYMRSLATRQSNLALSKYVQQAIDICRAARFDLIIVETSGIGQSDTEIVHHSNISLYIMTPEYGAATQLEKIDMLDFADVIVINKFDKMGAMDSLKDVIRQYRRNKNQFGGADENLPIFGTIASNYNDPGMNLAYKKIIQIINEKFKIGTSSQEFPAINTLQKTSIIPTGRGRYLGEIVDTLEEYKVFVREQTGIARKLFNVKGAIAAIQSPQHTGQKIRHVLEDPESIKKTEADSNETKHLCSLYERLYGELDPRCRNLLKKWPEVLQQFHEEKFRYQVRDRIFEVDLFSESLSHLKIPKISLPKYHDWGDILEWLLQENIPGSFPYSAGVFPLKRQEEEPGRQFAGEGGPERTNKRFHYVSRGMPAKRLSTAFDAVTLYGMDPDRQPDIYGKIGNSGVSVATLDDAKKLYSGFNLALPNTSVSMTINGPAPMILGFFLNAAIDQQCEIYIKENGLEEQTRKKVESIFSKKGVARPEYNNPLPETNSGLGLMLLGVTGDEVLPQDVYEKIKASTLSSVRGTVQADILKEDQGQNTCIFSTEFALRMMGDIQEYFIQNCIRNFYSVSISGYHIAEAGANPISQLAFTLSNGFTYVEYYLARGMKIDDFAPNLSFFFSNGLDPEYSVIGRVARRIWAKAMKFKYKANERSQKLKYHIQTSGRSLHAQEIGFNDIRTTLQGLCAIYDNCNSLHTNAYDEAITTPTEESVRRAMAIQLIINRELGITKNENPLQGSFIIEELTDLVEEEVMKEFRQISERGGVLGAMERMYQRSKIQDESMYYEILKHEGKIPIMGVNTFLDSEGSKTVIPGEVIRASTEEKEYSLSSLEAFKARNARDAAFAVGQLQKSVTENRNIFSAMMEASKVCSIGQMSKALYETGGQYRRNM